MTIQDRKGTRMRATRVVAALLCVAVVAIHVIDQGGFPGSKTPEYVGIGYWFLELVGAITAALLLFSWSSGPWLVALGVAAGPLIGYILSRGPGLPDYTYDKGNWTEPLGVLSLAVEVGLLALAGIVLTRARRPVSAVHRG